MENFFLSTIWIENTVERKRFRFSLIFNLWKNGIFRKSFGVIGVEPRNRERICSRIHRENSFASVDIWQTLIIVLYRFENCFFKQPFDGLSTANHPPFNLGYQLHFCLETEEW